MNNQRGQRKVRRQRVASADILQIEGHAVGHPVACIERPLTAHEGEKLAVGATDANLNHVRIWRIPTDRGRSLEGARRDWDWIRTGDQRRTCRTRRGWMAGIPPQFEGVGGSKVSMVCAQKARKAVVANHPGFYVVSA